MLKAWYQWLLWYLGFDLTPPAKPPIPGAKLEGHLTATRILILLKPSKDIALQKLRVIDITDELEKIIELPGDATSFHLYAPKNNTLHISIQAIDMVGNESPWSDSTVWPPFATTIISQEGDQMRVKISNLPPKTAADVASRELWIDRPFQSTPDIRPITDPNATEFQFNEPEGQTVTFRLRDIDDALNVGPWSDPSEPFLVTDTIAPGKPGTIMMTEVIGEDV